MVTSAKGKQDFKNWHRYFSLTLFEFWYERYDHLFFSRKKTPEGLKTCNFIKKRLQNWCFSCDYWVIFKNTFFTAHLRWLVVYTEWMNLLCLILFNKFVKVSSNPLVYFLWEIREDSLSKAQRKVNMKHHGFL